MYREIVSAGREKAVYGTAYKTAYWLGDQLTAEEKAKVLAAMTERGNQVLDVLKNLDFLTHPFSNHEGRNFAWQLDFLLNQQGRGKFAR